MRKNKLNIWRLHPDSARIIPAEKTLNGTASPSGVKFCRPFSLANSAGWWVFPSIDADIIWRGGKEYECRMLKEWDDSEYYLAKSLFKKEEDKENLDKWCPPTYGRTKFTWGGVEDNVVQFWTGCIFQTPPGWCLHIRSPINFPPRESCHIMEGVLETDWMQYDIWFNIVFDQKDQWLRLRKNEFPPLAQLIPCKREDFVSKWEIGTDELVNRDTEEANKVFEYWVHYNNEKFSKGGKQHLSTTDPNITKDSTTFHRERMRLIGKELKPYDK